ncbi:phospho-sugar mutase [Enterococcus sp. LJL99]
MDEQVVNKWKRGMQQQDEQLYRQLQLLSEAERNDCFSGKLSFGTGGMRGILGVGPNRMNRFTIRQAVYGFARTLSPQMKIVIGYDTRMMSKEFAEEAAGVLLAQGQTVHLFAEYAPTPEIVYALKNVVQADFGLVITASHNPKEYNGLKIYNKQGSQLVPEEIAPIIAQVNQIEDVFSIPIKKITSTDPHLFMLGSEIDQAYITGLQTVCCQPNVLKEGESVPVVYTPLHGTGQRIFSQLMEAINQPKYIVCEQQTAADGLFQHAPSPNPEDCTTFALSIALAQEHSAELILATDPDADRVGVMIKKGISYVHLTGNQVGILLLDYLIQQTPPSELATKVVLSTLVSTGMVHALSQTYGFTVKQFLTGFKYIGHEIGLATAEKEFLFGFEESCGYLIKPIVQDKDAFQAILLLLEMVLFYRKKNVTLSQRLEDLYQEYGYYLNELETIEVNAKPDLTKITKQFLEKNALVNFGFSAFEDYQRAVQVGDEQFFQTGIDTQDEFLRFSCDRESWICIRTSGTEPKIKIYYEMVAETQQLAQEKLRKYQATIQQLLKEI